MSSKLRTRLSNIANELDDLELYLKAIQTKTNNDKMSQFESNSYDLIFYLILCTIIVLFVWFCFDYIQVSRLPYSRNKLKQLQQATKKNDTVHALSLLEPSLINISNNGYTPFLWACSNGNTVLVKAMLSMGADINATTDNHENSFYLAAFNCVCNITSKDATCIHALFHAGVDINMPNNRGITPIQMAASFGHARLVQWLIAKGANLDVQPSLKEISLSNGYSDVAALLPKSR